MAHTLSGFRTRGKGPGTSVSSSSDIEPSSDLILHIGRQADLIQSHGQASTVVATARGWDVVDSFLERFSFGIPADEAAFSAAVRRWESAPRTVVYSVAGERDVLIGLSYQTTHDEILGAVWTGFCAGLAREVRAVVSDGFVRVVSRHPGTPELVHQLARLGLSATDAPPTAVDAWPLEADRLAHRVASTATAESAR